LTDSFGPILSLGDVQDAVLALLQTPPDGGGAPLIVYYLAERERLTPDMAPRTFDPPAAYRGGTDFTVFQEDQFPTVIVVVAPSGKPERFAGGTYSQWFEVQIGAIVKRETQDDARAHAHGYGIALAALIAQNGGLGPSTINPGSRFAIKTDLEEFPAVEFAFNATTSRNILRSTVTFQTRVAPVLGETGPPGFPHDPYADPEVVATIETVDVDLSILP
jgi:hypothetical protein